MYGKTYYLQLNWKPWLKRYLVALLATLVTMCFYGASQAQNDKKLSERELVTLVKFLDDEDVVDKVNSAGIAFSVDEAVLTQLKEAGASEDVLEAVRNAGEDAEAAQAITHQDVANLLRAGVPEGRILELLQASPSTFVLGADQERQLRQLGASDRLIAALQGDRASSGKSNAKISDLAVILDCSGSMAQKTTDGPVKMTVARRVVSDFIEGLPPGLHVTFVIYGHDEQLGCESVEVVRELAPLAGTNKPELIHFIETLQPASKTPIALSLRTAYDELAKRDKPCGLILISDGKETCNGNPQAEAARLANNLNCRFGVNVVGFEVDQEGQRQLDEVASAGGGEYFNATNAAELADRVSALAEKVDEAAVEPAIVTTEGVLTSITVKPLNLKGLPKIAEVTVYPPESDPTKPVRRSVQSTKELGEPMVVPEGTYNIWYQPDDGSDQVRMIADLEVSQGKNVTLDPNRLVGAIVVPRPQIQGLDEIEWIRVYYPQYDYSSAIRRYVQWTKRFDKPMLVPAGFKWNVWLKPEGAQAVPLAKGVEVQRGQVNVIGEKVYRAK